MVKPLSVTGCQREKVSRVFRSQTRLWKEKCVRLDLIVLGCADIKKACRQGKQGRPKRCDVTWWACGVTRKGVIRWCYRTITMAAAHRMNLFKEGETGSRESGYCLW